MKIIKTVSVLNFTNKLLLRNTCLIVGSAPTYPHGAYDDIEALSNLALKYGNNIDKIYFFLLTIYRFC